MSCSVPSMSLRACLETSHSQVCGTALLCFTRVSQASCHRQEAAIAGFSDAIAHERPFSLAMQLRSAGARAPVLHFIFRRAVAPRPKLLGLGFW